MTPINIYRFGRSEYNLLKKNYPILFFLYFFQRRTVWCNPLKEIEKKERGMMRLRINGDRRGPFGAVDD
jgi:hypothetical protein